jgi:predicted dehydrogenase
MGTPGVTAVTAAIRFRNDATGTIIGVCDIDFKLPLYELTFAFEHGRLSMRDLDGDLELLDYRTGQHELYALPRDVSRWDQYRASFGRAINAYLASIRAGQAPPVPGLAGLRELQFEAAIKRSIAQGAPVALDEAFPLDV